MSGVDALMHHLLHRRNTSLLPLYLSGFLPMSFKMKLGVRSTE